MNDRTPSHAELSMDEHGIAVLTVSNAKALNIVGSAAITDLTKALGGLRDQAALRVLVLRGSGERAFIGGADIHEMSTLTQSTAPGFITRLKNLCEALRALPVPVIARLSGWCLGGGLEVAMACDLRIAGNDARLGMPEVQVGIPSVIHAALMPRLIGQSAAAWLLLTGEPIDAATALSWGLVHRVVAPVELDDAVAQCARRLAALGPAVIRQQKALMRSWESLSLNEAVEQSVAQFARAFTTGEPQKYMAAFIDRKH
jgi:enoyl-CoA hydratase